MTKKKKLHKTKIVYYYTYAGFHQWMPSFMRLTRYFSIVFNQKTYLLYNHMYRLGKKKVKR